MAQGDSQSIQYQGFFFNVFQYSEPITVECWKGLWKRGTMLSKGKPTTENDCLL